MIYDITILTRKVLAMYPLLRQRGGKSGISGNRRYRDHEKRWLHHLLRPTVHVDAFRNDQLFLSGSRALHIAFEHKERGVGKDPTVWMSATDAVINQM